uniref:dentin sialophosphoprotein-like isoform X6 n=1 Tax=Jaculus jaculus TaxID=51337 RepID=UPI001E1B1B51|nr:dentin sialophosphoprotein-like isoform X6 [Jaculus jaculus]
MLTCSLRSPSCGSVFLLPCRTALHYACAYGHREVVHLLLDYECTISVFDNEQCTPLIKASQREFHLCVDTLLTHGADPNDADMYGNTALHYAALNDDLELADLLLAYDANIEAKTKEGFTPYLLALQENKDFIAEFLEHMGADIHAEELLDRKHRKMHRRRICKHTVRRREAARSTSPSFYRRATNRGARDSETERDEQDNDFNAQVERVRKKCLLKELTGSEKLHRRAAATVSAAADPAAPGSGSAAPASSAAAADGTDPPVPATPAPPASPAPTSTPATTIPDVDPFDSPAPSACDTLDGSDAPDAPHIPDGTDTLHGPDSPDGPDSLDVPNPLHDPDTPTDLSAPADHAPLSSPIYLHLLFLLVLLVFFHLPLPFLMPLLFLLLLVMLCPYRPHAPLASSAPDTADGPDTYDGPDTPDGADTPDDPNTTDGPNITDGNDSPNGPDNSDRPANADGPDTPDGPYIPDGLDTSDGPVFPDGSKYPDVPDTAHGPYTSDAPDSTNVSEYPDGLVTHHGPVTSNASDNPDLPVTPDGLDACDCPDTINDSDNTHGLVTPAGPDTPDDLHTPGGQDSPDSSDDPDGPNTCDVPVTHDGPDNHDDPDTLDGPDNTVVLDNPVGPDTPDVSDTSDGLDKPDGPDNPDGPDTRDGPDTPHSMDTCDDPDTSAVPDTSEASTTSVGFEISNGSSTSENPRVSDGPDAQDGPDSPAPPAALLDPAITVDADVPAPRSVPADGPASPKAADYDDEEHALKAVKDVPTKEKNDKNESACPLEKGTKHEITKSPLKELVRIPTPKTSTAEMDTPKGVSGHLVSDSTIRMERNNQAFSYKCLMNGAPCPLAEEKKSENSKFTTSESVSASTSAGSPFEMGTVPEPQVDGSHVSGDLHRTGRRNERAYPLEKGNKSAITKSQLRELVRIPTRETSNSEMDSPYSPDTSGVPDTLDGPDTHNGLDTCDGPDTTTLSDHPDGPYTSDGTDTSYGPHNPDGPDIPEGPDTPDGADIPVGSDNPHDPDTPDGPDIPFSLGTSDDTDTSDVPDTSEGPITPVGPINSDGCSTSENPRVSHGPNAQDGPESPAPLAALLDRAISEEAEVPAPLSVPADGPASPNAADYDDEEHALQVVEVVPTKEKNDKNESACPLEKVNKREITKRPFNELVRTSTPKTSTAKMDTLVEVNGRRVSGEVQHTGSRLNDGESTVRLERNDQAFSYKCLRNERAYPLEKENKSAITKSQLRELVRIPTRETSTSEMDSPYGPDSSGGPDPLEGLDTHDGLDTCDGPDTTTVSDNADSPDSPDGTDTSDGPHNPDGPDIPDGPDTPDGADIPVGSDNPHDPDTPDGPDTPYSLGTSDDPDPSDVPDTSEGPSTPVGPITSDGCSTSESPRVSHGPNAQDGPESPAPLAALLDRAISEEAEVPAPLSVPADGPPSPNAADYDDEEHALQVAKVVPAKEKNDKNESACPLEKVNKREITKSPLNELVRTSTPKTSTAEMDTLMEVNVHRLSESTVRLERNDQAFSYKCLRNERAYPLEKGNKSAITKRQLRELVRIPTRETSTSEMDSPYTPDSSGGPDPLDGLDTHDGLDTCDGPDTTTVSDNLDGPDSPDGTDTSDGPHNPDGPDIPDGPDTTDGADIPVGSDNPHDPDTPDGPDTPYSLGTSDDPDPSDVPDTSEGPSTPVGPITSDGCSTSESPRVSHGPNAQDGPESPAPLAALLDPAISAEADVPAPLSVPADGPASPNAADYDDEEHALQVAKVVHTKEKNDKNESACPLEKVNKREITKSPLKKLVRPSTPKTSTAEMDKLMEVNGHPLSESTIRLERNDHAFPYKYLRKERAYPLGKGNKSAITKSQLRELVSIPTPETSTAGMDSMMEINSLSASDSTVGMENKYKVVPYKRLKEVNNSENDITVIGNEEMEKHKGFLHLNWKLGTAHKKHIKRSEPPCPLAEEKKSENSKFTTRESVSASTSERSPVETDTAQQAQVDGSHVPGDLHHTGRRAAENTSTELHKVGERVDRRSRRFHSFSINNFRRLIFFRSFEVL